MFCFVFQDFLLLPAPIRHYDSQNNGNQRAVSIEYQTALDLLRKYSNLPLESEKTLHLPNEFNYNSLRDKLHHIGYAQRQDQKRSLDSIQHLSNFGGFGKRSLFPVNYDSGTFGGFENDGFDSNVYARSADRLGKRSFDSISGVSGFGGLGKRTFDSISGFTRFGGLGKRSFDSISGISNFGGLGKRGFDSINHFTGFGGLGKRSYDSTYHDRLSGGLSKRRIDHIQ
jgi:hypothetical protein